MRPVLRIVLEGSAVVALALFAAALHCALRSLRARRAGSAAEGLSGHTVTPARRPTFLSRKNLLSN